MNYSTNKVKVRYFVELPQSNFPDYPNSQTLGLFPDFSRTLKITWHSRFPEKW